MRLVLMTDVACDFYYGMQSLCFGMSVFGDLYLQKHPPLCRDVTHEAASWCSHRKEMLLMIVFREVFYGGTLDQVVFKCVSRAIPLYFAANRIKRLLQLEILLDNQQRQRLLHEGKAFPSSGFRRSEKKRRKRQQQQQRRDGQSAGDHPDADYPQSAASSYQTSAQESELSSRFEDHDSESGSVCSSSAASAATSRSGNSGRHRPPPRPVSLFSRNPARKQKPLRVPAFAPIIVSVVSVSISLFALGRVIAMAAGSCQDPWLKQCTARSFPVFEPSLVCACHTLIGRPADDPEGASCNSEHVVTELMAGTRDNPRANDFVRVVGLHDCRLNQTDVDSLMMRLTQVRLLDIAAGAPPANGPFRPGSDVVTVETRAPYTGPDAGVMIPLSIGRLSLLESVEFAGVGVAAALDALSASCRKLRLVAVSGDATLTQVPSSLDRLSSLRIFEAITSRLSALPGSLGRLSMLNVLTVYENNITALPTELGELSGLHIFSISNNRITSLPASFGRLTKLKKLRAQSNQLTAPCLSTLTTLAALTYLDLGHNALSVAGLPEGLSRLSQLKVFRFDMAGVRSWPHWIGALEKLTRLNGNDNPVDRPLSERLLQTMAQRLTNLEELHMRGWTMEEGGKLPANFGRFSHLHMLDLSEMGLRNLPESFSDLTALQGLLLRSNEIRAIPSGFGRLTRLSLLNIGDNKMRHISVLPKLERLERLGLPANELSEIPAGLAKLTKLVYLDLCCNGMVAQAEPAISELVSLADLPVLAALNVEGNSISAAALDALWSALVRSISGRQARASKLLKDMASPCFQEDSQCQNIPAELAWRLFASADAGSSSSGGGGNSSSSSSSTSCRVSPSAQGGLDPLLDPLLNWTLYCDGSCATGCHSDAWFRTWREMRHDENGTLQLRWQQNSFVYRGEACRAACDVPSCPTAQEQCSMSQHAPSR